MAFDSAHAIVGGLPPVVPNRRGFPYFYGVTSVASSYCGLPRDPGFFRGIWQHGWVPGFCQVHPRAVLALDPAQDDKDEYFWVARKDEESYLHGAGYHRVRAIGLPALYVPGLDAPRVPGSLLVMPVHSIPSGQLTYDFAGYAQALKAIRDRFSVVLACVQQACIDRGYWVRELEDAGIPILVGAGGSDDNSLRRMRHLMQTFEYVTTNGLGSHMPYAAYWGAKLSVWGTEYYWTHDDLAGDPSLDGIPEALDVLVSASARNAISKIYEMFRGHPWDAVEHRDWGARELGGENVVAPSELRRLLAWTALERVKWKADRLWRTVRSPVR